MPLTVSNFLVGPLIAFAVVGVLAGILQWMFSRRPRASYELPMPVIEDYGLLCAAAVTEDPDSAESMRSMLTAAGIRATLVTGADGRVRVLVFEDEVHRARRVMG